MSENKIKAVHIDGDKSNFVSKAAIEKFKSKIKQAESFDFKNELKTLSEAYLKPEYKFNLVKNFDNEVTVKINYVPVKNQPKNENRELLKAKINLMSKARTNSVVHNAKSNNIDDEIITAYTQLTKMCKVPIPDPNEILANPNEYRPIINMVLNNGLMKKDSNHPYTRYFSLLAKKIGADGLPFSIPNVSNTPVSLPTSLNDVMKLAGAEELEGKTSTIVNDADTDDEDN